MGSINFNPVPMNFELVSFRVELGFEGEDEKRLAFGASHEKVDNLERFRMLFKDNESFAIFSGEKNEFAEVRNEGPFIIINADRPSAVPGNEENQVEFPINEKREDSPSDTKISEYDKSLADEGNQADVSSNDLIKDDTSEAKENHDVVFSAIPNNEETSGAISNEDGNQEDVATNDATKDDASSEMEDSNAIPATQNNDTTADEGNQANVSSNDATKEDTSEVKFSVFPSQEESLNNSTIPYEQQDPNVMTSDDGTIFIDMPGEEEDNYDDEDFCDIKFAASGSLVNRDKDLVAFAFSCVDQVLADMVGQAMDEAAPSEAGQNEEVPQDVTADLLQPVRYLMDNFGELLHHFNMQCLSDAEAEV